MGWVIWIVSGGTVLLVGVLSYAVARRYGAGLALMLPVLALVAFLGMEWQARAPGDRVDLWASLAFAAPVLFGAMAGVALAWFRRA